MNLHFCKVGTIRPNLSKRGLGNNMRNSSVKIEIVKKDNKNQESTR